jgi:hypothetical protein
MSASPRWPCEKIPGEILHTETLHRDPEVHRHRRLHITCMCYMDYFPSGQALTLVIFSRTSSNPESSRKSGSTKCCGRYPFTDKRKFRKIDCLSLEVYFMQRWVGMGCETRGAHTFPVADSYNRHGKPPLTSS